MKQTLAAFLLVSALASAPAFSQTDRSSMSGVIVSTTASSLVVRMDDGTRRTFAVDSTTTVPSTRLAEGNRITVQYQPLDAGRFQAQSVALFDASATPTPSEDMNSRSNMEQTNEPARTSGSVAVDPTLNTPVRPSNTVAVEPARNTPNRNAGSATEEPARNADNDNNLPRTASSMPGLALAGCLALFTGLALSAVRRRA